MLRFEKKIQTKYLNKNLVFSKKL